MNSKRYRQFRRLIIREFSSARFMWIANLLLVVGLLNACGDAFSPKDCGNEAGCESNASESASPNNDVNSPSSWGGGSGGTGGTSGTSGSQMTTSTYGGGGGQTGTSTSASSGGSGGATVSTSSGASGGSTSTSTNSNSAYTFDMPLTIMAEPMDINVEETDVFSLIFIAYGKRPLTYKWYKKGNPSPIGSGEGQTIYYNTGASMNDGGTYYAEVTDANGDKLKSRETRVNVKEGRKPCEAGEFGPSSNYWSSGAFNSLVSKQQMQASGYYYNNLTINLGKTKDAYIVNVNCSFKSNYTGYIACDGSSSMRYQCRNGSYSLVVDTCTCQEDYGE